MSQNNETVVRSARSDGILASPVEKPKTPVEKPKPPVVKPKPPVVKPKPPVVKPKPPPKPPPKPDVDKKKASFKPGSLSKVGIENKKTVELKTVTEKKMQNLVGDYKKLDGESDDPKKLEKYVSLLKGMRDHTRVTNQKESGITNKSF